MCLPQTARSPNQQHRMQSIKGFGELGFRCLARLKLKPKGNYRFALFVWKQTEQLFSRLAFFPRYIFGIGRQFPMIPGMHLDQIMDNQKPGYVPYIDFSWRIFCKCHRKKG